jgi:hypothetical protein
MRSRILNETLTIGDDDVDIIKGTRSRLKVGTLLVPRRNAAPGPDVVGKPRGFRPVAALSRRARGFRRRHEPEGPGFWASSDTRFHDRDRPDRGQRVEPARPGQTGRCRSPVPVDPGILHRHRTASSASPVASSNSATPILWSKARRGRSACPRPATSTRPGKCLVMQAWFNNKPIDHRAARLLGPDDPYR